MILFFADVNCVTWMTTTTIGVDKKMSGLHSKSDHQFQVDSSRSKDRKCFLRKRKIIEREPKRHCPNWCIFDGWPSHFHSHTTLLTSWCVVCNFGANYHRHPHIIPAYVAVPHVFHTLFVIICVWCLMLHHSAQDSRFAIKPNWFLFFFCFVSALKDKSEIHRTHTYHFYSDCSFAHPNGGIFNSTVGPRSERRIVFAANGETFQPLCCVLHCFLPRRTCKC